MREKKIKMRYTGHVPVRIPGIPGHINRHEQIEVPEKIANNLDRDLFFEIAESKKKEKQSKIIKKEGKNE